MTLFVQVRVWRKGIEELTHLTKGDEERVPELGWVTWEGDQGEIVVAGFAADGSPYIARGLAADLLTEPKPQASPRATEASLQTSEVSGSSPPITPQESAAVLQKVEPPVLTTAASVQKAPPPPSTPSPSAIPAPPPEAVQNPASAT